VADGVEGADGADGVDMGCSLSRVPGELCAGSANCPQQ
jgi:hypothetical protein